MQFDNQKVTEVVNKLDKRGLSGLEIIAVGKALESVGEAQKEADMVEEYMKATIDSQLMSGGGSGTMN